MAAVALGAWLAGGGARAAAAVPTLGGAATEVFFDNGAVAVDVTVPPGADGYLLLAVATAGGDVQVREASHAGRALGFIGRVVSPAGSCQVEWWGLVAPAEGPQRFQATLSARALAGGAVMHYRGVAARGSVGFAGARGSSGPSIINIPGQTEEVILDAVCGWGAQSVIWQAGAGQRAHWHWSSGSLSTAGSARPAGEDRTLSWTASGPGPMEWAAAGLSLRPAGAVLSLPLEVETAGCSAGGGRAGIGPGWLVLLWGLAWRATRRYRRPFGNLGRPMACNRKGPCVQARLALHLPSTATPTSTR
jgi:hypothetical protein